MLAIAPSRVQAERVEPGNTAPLGRLIEELRAGGVRAVSPNGVLGDPSGANAEEGARRLESIVAEALARLGTGIPDERGCLVPVAPGGTS